MKKLKLVFAGLFFLFLSSGTEVRAQTSADYFEGEWNVLVKGTPSGDAKLILVLEQEENELTGVVQDSTGKEISIIDKAELKEDTATVYFYAQGYDVNLQLTKEDENHVTGSLMGMFPAKGERIKITEN